METQPGYSGDEMFECCGKIMNNDDWTEGMSRAEDEEPYCYEGVHWEREIETDDEEGESGLSHWDLGMKDSDGNMYEKVWWREWREHGNTCQEMRCGKSK